MKIIGIDPGLAILGWSVLEEEGGQPKRVHYGCIRTHQEDPLATRLAQIFEDLNTLIEKHRPTIMSLETLFFAKNARTLAQVGHSRGVILLTAAQNKLTLFEYAPRQIKSSLTGYGGADKKQMQKALQNRLALPAIPKPDDAADAVAVALCHLQYAQMMGKTAITI